MTAKDLEQKYVKYDRNITRDGPSFWLYGDGCSDSYMASQCQGRSGLEQDLKTGWIIKHCWEDCYQIVFILERMK